MYRPAHAVVLGGSFVGLLVARVLAKHFVKVTIAERDEIADIAAPRKGVPQSRLYHSLLARGRHVAEELLPGLHQSLIDGGAVEYKFGRDSLIYTSGYRHGPYDGPSGVSLTRPYLEMHVRRRVLAMSNIELVGGVDILGLALSKDRKRVSQIKVRSRSGDKAERLIDADLVVDTTGRGSVTSRWLEELGYPAPQETRVKMRAGAATRFYAVGKETIPWKAITLFRCGERRKRVAFMSQVEPAVGSTRGRWCVVLAGLTDVYPSGNEADYLKFAEGMPTPVVADFIRTAEPLSEIESMKAPSSIWRHYERLKDFPESFVVLGDALCTFNPIYGQGMTIGAIGASLLDQCLAEGLASPNGLRGLARSCYARLLQPLTDAWMMSALPDLMDPEVEGQRSVKSKVVGGLHDLLLVAAGRDPHVAHKWVELANMTAPPQHLMRPTMLWRTLRAASGFSN